MTGVDDVVLRAEEITFVYYYYLPSAAAAGIFILLFGALAVMHLWQLVRSRSWFCIPFFLGVAAECIGYGGRMWSHFQAPDYTAASFSMQFLLLLIAPALFAATVYMILGRIVRLVDGEAMSLIPLRWLTKIFVLADVASLVTQGAGGAFLSTADTAEAFDDAESIIIGGLFIQLIAFGIFIIVTTTFHYRILRYPTTVSMSLLSTRPPLYSSPGRGGLIARLRREIAFPTWKTYLVVLELVSILIFVRSLFRVIEYIQGWDGEINSSEAYLYVFDALLMLVVVAAMSVWHPSGVQAQLDRSRSASGRGRGAGYKAGLHESRLQMDDRSINDDEGSCVEEARGLA